ncbi:hypothetical protein [Fulvivirga sedimenti]|uniref:Uncharacterized protein n=1 Tax=Fulvivirga sedimenti TaxID=2879465 RepID=A0A9X1HX83_9BACT|nr:hypothetical protein [Fulvivirga sedimenti]MCA6078112.1 hypothetical protein [Fulvivirga sedimenti]
MDLKDLIVTPIYFSLILFVAFVLRPYFTTETTRKYFIPALSARLVAAILLGLLYQYYYNGGDTYNFHTRGSEIIADVFWENPISGLKLLFSNGNNIKGLYYATSEIPFYRDSSSFMIIRIAAVFDLITFSTYSATALFFALFSFSGLWVLYNVFIYYFPRQTNLLAYSVLFVPSVIFWGSGILKDTITLGALGWLVFGIHQVFFLRNGVFRNSLIILISSWLIFQIKIYLLLAIIPAIMIWFFLRQISSIRNIVLRSLVAPVLLIIGILAAYYSAINVTRDDPRYSVDALAKTARTTAYDIAFWTGRSAGSTYDLGEMDGTFVGLLRLAPKGVLVSLFRPFPWEIRNALMAFLSIESFLILLLTIYVLIRAGGIRFFRSLSNPVIFFCMVFSLVFAFAVGVSTYNFGSLARYKIPLIPFYLSMLVMILDYSKSDRNIGDAQATE